MFFSANAALAQTSPCPCTSGTSCNGMSYTTEAAALADYNAMAGPPLNSSATGCFDLSASNIPADDGNVYEFCYQYTHNTSDPTFAINGAVFFTTPLLNSGCASSSAVDIAVYESGNCVTEVNAIAITTNNWPAYSCLLYTSPSPRDLSTSRMPSSA